MTARTAESAAAGHSLQFIANCSTLYGELPLRERPRAAAEAGFTAVEFWWPWSTATPFDREVEEFVAAIRDAGVRLVGLNFFAGELAGADCGALSVPALSTAFRDSIPVAVSVADKLGVRFFNALYGNRVPDSTAAEQDALAAENLRLAGTAAAGVGACVLIEAVSGPKPYPLRTSRDALAVVSRARADGVDNVAFLCDLFHLAANGDPFAASLERVSDIGHVQIADFPGRDAPGTGRLPIGQSLAALQVSGYDGYVALEYIPAGDTETSLAWLPRERRAATFTV